MRKSLTIFLIAFTAVFCFSTKYAYAALKPVFQDIGKISISVDAEGNNEIAGGTVQVNKPPQATVKRAFLMASSNHSRKIKNGDILLERKPILWGKDEFNDIVVSDKFFHSVFADVTSIVKSIIDSAPAGISNLVVVEKDTVSIDGVILFVVFNDPNVTKNNSVILVFGGQAIDGDTFLIHFPEPVVDGIEKVDMGLGIGYGYQDTFGTNQVNLIDVNDIRLTSSAGGEDDGASYNGALITVGGIGDTNNNPDPFIPSSGFNTDDELYNLLPFIDAGDEQIKVFSTNPSRDDNIFFSYFFLSKPAALLSAVAKPLERRLQTENLTGDVDPTKPTVILTHGLQGVGIESEELWSAFTDNRQAGSLLAQALGNRVNVLQYVWEEANQVPWPGIPGDDSYITARRNVYDAGERLARLIEEELGTQYNQPIHFIGHSLGTATNAYAARRLLNDLPVTRAQFTILDYPNHVTKILGLSDKEEGFYGFDADFFATILPINKNDLTLKIDNYYGAITSTLSSAAVGDIANGPVYNHNALEDTNDLDDVLFEESLPADNDHTGVHQWYRWTIKPNNPFPDGPDDVCIGSDIDPSDYPGGFDRSLNPCNRGWYWSVNNPEVLNNVTRWLLRFPKNNGGTVQTTTFQTLDLEEQVVVGNCNVAGSTQSSRGITCYESSSPFVVFNTTIPENARYISFDYNVISAGDGDYFSVLLDDEPVWVLSGVSANEGEWVNTGAIPVHAFTGERRLTIALFGVNEKNAVIGIQNFQTFGTETSPTEAVTPRSLKEKAIQELGAAMTGDERVDKKVEGIAELILRSLNSDLWLDADHLDPVRGKEVFQAENEAIMQMSLSLKMNDILQRSRLSRATTTSMTVLPDNVKNAFEQVTKDLLQADELLVQTALEEVRDLSASNSLTRRLFERIISLAEQQFRRALSYSKTRPEFAIARYSIAWQLAQTASKYSAGLLTETQATELMNAAAE